MQSFRVAAAAITCALLSMAEPAGTVQDLFRAIRGNDLTRLRELIRDPAAIQAVDDKGISPLLYASAFGSVDAMRMLIDAEADVNAAEPQGATPLHWAACDPVRSKLLLEHGAKADAKMAQGRTPLLIASGCEAAADSVQLLLRKGADVNARQQNNGATPLSAAALSGGPRICRMLLAAGARADTATTDGWTALMYAVGYRDVELVKMLIAGGAQVNAKNISSGKVRHGDIDMKELTALMLAVPFGSPEMVKALLDAGADVRAHDGRGMTPLMFAVASDNQDARVARLLVERGAEVNAVSSSGETALDWAHKFNEPDVLKVLEKAGATGHAAPPLPEGRPRTLRDPKAAAAVSAGLLQRGSAEFFKESGCIGCHHQPMMAMAVKAARDGGIPVDEKDLAEQRKAISLLLAPRPARLLTAQSGGGGIDTMVNAALGLWSAGYESDLLTDSIAVLLAATQNSDGSFGGAALGSRAPLQESFITLTAHALRALQLCSFPARKAEFDQRIARAGAWLAEAKPRTEYEQADVLLGLYWSGAPPDRLQRAAKPLIADQRPDGGWAQRTHLPTDAYMTGVALYALSESRQLRPRDPAYRRGVDYLLRTQMEDGSWHVRSRAVKLQPYFQSGFPYDHDQWISYTATAYATTALAAAAK
jgi:ankyrin repeat protein